MMSLHIQGHLSEIWSELTTLTSQSNVRPMLEKRVWTCGRSHLLYIRNLAIISKMPLALEFYILLYHLYHLYGIFDPELLVADSIL